MEASQSVLTAGMVDVIVRREKALDFSGCNSRPEPLLA